MKSQSQIKSMLLDNNVGLTDLKRIAEAETLFMTLAAAEGLPSGEYDLCHLQGLHAHMFGDMYSWAGLISTSIESSKMQALITTLGAFSKLPTSEMTSVGLASALAVQYVELLSNNPFEHGGRRAIRSLIESYAHDCGMMIDWGLFPGEMLDEAVQSASDGNTSNLTDIFIAMTSHQDLFQAESVDGCALKTADIFQAAGLTEAVVRLQPIIGESDSSALMRAVSEAFKKSLVETSQMNDSLQYHWDRTSTFTHDSPSDQVPTTAEITYSGPLSSGIKFRT
ncbi:hypothetical protein [Pseudomonas syringae]|uniref:hypothetical protein n=1 Tax=Pseudomonas syringae TaxID=317 RepID=UPI00245DC3C5|nr:hypothetical protein [Pseudomonas syringae]MDH4602438.1 hypothetical protein [Pseudomonas syringae pv. papulans]